MVSYCDYWMSVECYQHFLLKTSPKLLAEFYPNLAEMILIWPSLIMFGSGLLHILVTQAENRFSR